MFAAGAGNSDALVPCCPFIVFGSSFVFSKGVLEQQVGRHFGVFITRDEGLDHSIPRNPGHHCHQLPARKSTPAAQPPPPPPPQPPIPTQTTAVTTNTITDHHQPAPTTIFYNNHHRHHHHREKQSSTPTAHQPPPTTKNHQQCRVGKTGGGTRGEGGRVGKGRVGGNTISKSTRGALCQVIPQASTHPSAQPHNTTYTPHSCGDRLTICAGGGGWREARVSPGRELVHSTPITGGERRQHTQGRAGTCT